MIQINFSEAFLEAMW